MRINHGIMRAGISALAGLTALLGSGTMPRAYQDWSSGCSNCHGGFTSSSYTSRAHKVPWSGGLHSVHVSKLNSDCGVCHTNSGGGTTPVYTYKSVGMKNGTQTLALGCTGCHDATGLRQYHRTKGASSCDGCHDNPETAQAENVARPYYFTPDAAHPNKPTDPCNANGSETFAGTPGSPNGLDNDGNGAFDANDSACVSKPAAPKADAGPAQTAASGATVTLDGSNSTGTGLTYRWIQTAGTPVTLQTPNAVRTTFVAPSVGTSGAALTFQLTVTDSASQTSSATTTVNVTHLNQPPVANAGPTQTAKEGASVTLDGSNSSDPDGSIASYKWSQTAGPTVTLSSTTIAKPTFTAPSVSAAGASLVFQLTVTDNGGLTASASTTVNVTNVNQPPIANAGPNQTVKQGATVVLDGSNSTDPDGTIASYRWTQTSGPSVTLSNPATAKPTFVAPTVTSAGAALGFQLTVTDDGGLTASATTIVNVTYVNQPPVANAGPTQSVASGANVTLDGSNSSDPDGSIAAYRWTQTAGPSVTLSNAAAAKPTFTAPTVTVGTALTFQLTVTDNGGLTASATTIVNVSPADTKPPVANAGAPQTIAEGTLVTLDGSASTGSIASYHWTQTAGPSVTLSSPTAIKPTYTAPQVGTSGASLTFQLTVTDAGGLSSSATVIDNVTNVNRPPIADAGANQTVAAGATVTLDGSKSSDPDGAIASTLWSQTAGTAVTLSDPRALRPTFTAPATAGTLTFQLKVTDDGGLASSATVNITVTTTQTASVTLTASPASPQRAGTPITLTATGRGPDAPYVYRFSIQLPGGRWFPLGGWSSTTTRRLATWGFPAGTYQVRVEMKPASATTATPVASATISYTLTKGEVDDDDFREGAVKDLAREHRPMTH